MVKVLAIDTATEQCSVALRLHDTSIERAVVTERGHADLVLPLIAEVLAEAGVALTDIDCLAYGRGPGAFTGVRIAVAVAQGLAYGAGLPTVGVSTLAAVAQQYAPFDGQLLVCMDARMREVYWGSFTCSAAGLVTPAGEEQVGPPMTVHSAVATQAVGTGFKAYPELVTQCAGLSILPATLPHARQIARLGAAAFAAGEGRAAAEASPVYLRDRVANVKSP
jgi:tRNA threonylcarbamoyladenosine biosynthesis protein TsaB